MWLTQDKNVARAGNKTFSWKVTEIFRSSVILQNTKAVLLIKKLVPRQVFLQQSLKCAAFETGRMTV